MATDASSAGEVYTDTVPGRRERHGYTPTPRPLPRAYDFRTPDLPTPAIARPTAWPETAQTREQVMAAAAELDADAGEKERNLKARLVEAKNRGWLGEVEGLEISVAGAEQKLATMQKSSPQSSI